MPPKGSKISTINFENDAEIGRKGYFAKVSCHDALIGLLIPHYVLSFGIYQVSYRSSLSNLSVSHLHKAYSQYNKHTTRQAELWNAISFSYGYSLILWLPAQAQVVPARVAPAKMLP